MTNTIYAVGLGPGDTMYLTPQAKAIIDNAEVVVGYTLYIDLIRDLCHNKKTIDTGMMHEVERSNLAVEEAQNGKSVAIVCSGDSSVYGMASLLFEIIDKKAYNINVEVIPGITAALSVGAELGSPLTNDFTVISLSNLLTPEQLIIKRLNAAANADMVTVLYNPRSKRRHKLIAQTKDIFLNKNPNKKIVAGYVKNAGRDNKTIWVGLLCNLNLEDIDMLTTVIIGNSQTDIIKGKMITHRGYHTKYEL